MEKIKMPMLPGATGTRKDKQGLLRPMKELWDAPTIVRSVAAFAALVLWLDVEASERWKKVWLPDKIRNGKVVRKAKWATYCDHYAADFIFQLLRAQKISAWVWWLDKVIAAWKKGEPWPEAVRLETVREHGAKGLHNWMQEYGSEFGWRRVTSDVELQECLNKEVTFGLVTTAGHVSVALPDACGPLLGVAARGRLLTSQAGSLNVRARRSKWWGKNGNFYVYEGWE